MRKRMVTAVLIIILLLSLSACGHKSASSTGVIGGEGTDKLEEFTVVLDWYPNAVHGFLYEAIEKGYYAKEGLKVTIQFPSNTNDALSMTSAGKADAGIYYLQDVVMARANQNVPVKAIGTIVQEPLNIILSLKEKNITSPKDLKGKKIGYAGTELSEALIQTIIEDVGISMEDVTMIDVGFDLMSSMTTGNVDATIGCMANHEVPAMIEEGFEVNYFFLNPYGVPDYYELVFVTGDTQIEKESQKLEKFLRASQKGFEDMKNNPQEALKILLENQNAENFPLKETVEKQNFEIILPMMETESTPFLTQKEEVWQNNIDWLKERGLLQKEIKAEDVMTTIIK